MRVVRPHARGNLRAVTCVRASASRPPSSQQRRRMRSAQCAGGLDIGGSGLNEAPPALKARQCPLRSASASPPGFATKSSLLQVLVTAYNRLVLRFVASKPSDPPVTFKSFLGVTAIMVNNLDAAKQLISQEASGHVSNKPPKACGQVAGQHNILFSSKQEHKALRSPMLQTLSAEVVEGHLSLIQALVGENLDAWATECMAGAMVSAAVATRLLILEITFVIALGRRATQGELAMLQLNIDRMGLEMLTAVPIDCWPFPFHEGMNARRALAAFVQQQMDQVRVSQREGQQPSCFLATLMSARDQDGELLSVEQVTDNFLMFLIAGHETTAAQLTRLLADLAAHPQVLSKVREEQHHVVATHGHAFTPAALRGMPYTQAVLSETLRMAAPIGSMFRTCQEDLEVAGYTIPAGVLTVVQLRAISQTDPRWPANSLHPSDPMHPSHYNPDRFLTAQSRAPGTQVAFGIGAHSCPGMLLAQTEAKIFLAVLARGYEYSSDLETKWDMTTIPKPTNGLPLYFKRLG